ncbi:MAG: glycoside hydrolase family 88 protein [Opitutaceae bacterium]|nr:glycoside hydrolase family 88 protein [Opitutaceae bacterium]
MATPARQVPFAWPALTLDSSGVELRFAAPSSLAKDTPANLRITLALEQSTCSVVIVETLAPTATPRTELARFDLRYGCVFQIFSTPLSPSAAAHIAREPVRLRLLSGPPITIFTAAVATTPSDFPPEFSPHLLAAAPPAPPEAVLPRLATLACLQPFNWLHGCVVDALADAGDHAALSAHLGRWFHADGHLRYLGPHSEPRLDELFGLEPVLMFAALARHDPCHPAWKVLRRWLAKHTESDGLIIDRGLDAEGLASAVTYISIEAAYTVAYPLALAATALNEPSWRDLAVHQIRHRLAHLVRDGVVCQRAPLGGPGEQPHWARANAWFLLGLVKTLRALGDHDFVPEGIALLRTHAARILAAQRPDGLWSVYLDDPAASPPPPSRPCAPCGATGSTSPSCSRRCSSSPPSTPARE